MNTGDGRGGASDDMAAEWRGIVVQMIRDLRKDVESLRNEVAKEDEVNEAKEVARKNRDALIRIEERAEIRARKVGAWWGFISALGVSVVSLLLTLWLTGVFGP